MAKVLGIHYLRRYLRLRFFRKHMARLRLLRKHMNYTISNGTSYGDDFRILIQRCTWIAFRRTGKKHRQWDVVATAATSKGLFLKLKDKVF